MRPIEHLGYDEVVNSFECDILTKMTLGSYQGEYVYLIKKPDEDAYSIVSLDYGSCSYCDFMERIESDDDAIEQATEYRNNVWDSLIWRARGEMLAYLSDPDSDYGSWYGEPEYKPSFLGALSNS